MVIRRKAKKSPLTDFVSMIVPDRIEEAYERVDDYFTQHLKLSFDAPENVVAALNDLISQHGEPVRKALYGLICEKGGALHGLTSSAMVSGGKSAAGVLVPALVAQFALAPAVALLVATLVIKTISAGGEKVLCEGMILQGRKTARSKRARAHVQATSAVPKERHRPAAAAGGSKTVAKERATGGTGAGKPAADRKTSRTGEQNSAVAGGTAKPSSAKRTGPAKDAGQKPAAPRKTGGSPASGAPKRPAARKTPKSTPQDDR